MIFASSDNRFKDYTKKQGFTMFRFVHKVVGWAKVR